jgi:hypothetical protein
MGAEPSLSAVDKLLYLGRVSWPHAAVPIAFFLYYVATNDMYTRSLTLALHHALAS